MRLRDVLAIACCVWVFSAGSAALGWLAGRAQQAPPQVTVQSPPPAQVSYQGGPVEFRPVIQPSAVQPVFQVPQAPAPVIQQGQTTVEATINVEKVEARQPLAQAVPVDDGAQFGKLIPSPKE